MSSPPPLYRRVALSIGLLAAFYLTSITLVALLLAFPCGVVWAYYVELNAHKHENVLSLGALVVGCVVPAWLIARGLFVRPPRFVAPGPALVRRETPAFFELVDAVASAANTSPPAEVYMSADFTLAVTERGGLFGIGSSRVLVVGAPLVSALSVAELKAGLAHEMGHYLGGETRLGGVVGYTHALFRSVFVSLHASSPGGMYGSLAHTISRFLARFVVVAFARAYLRLTRPIDRRMELAADALAARLTGSATVVRCLEKVSVFARLYDAYLERHVALAVDHGAMPSDLLEGFWVFARDDERMRATVDAVQAKEADPLDSHPSTAERIAAVRALALYVVATDDRPAAALFSGQEASPSWLLRATLERCAPDQDVAIMPWAEIPARAIAPSYQKHAATLVASLRLPRADIATCSSTFYGVVQALARGEAYWLACHLFPSLPQAPLGARPALTDIIVARMLRTVFVGALLDQGACVELALDQPDLTLTFEGERLAPGRLSAESLTDAEKARAVLAWAERLHPQACATARAS